MAADKLEYSEHKINGNCCCSAQQPCMPERVGRNWRAVSGRLPEVCHDHRTTIVHAWEVGRRNRKAISSRQISSENHGDHIVIRAWL